MPRLCRPVRSCEASCESRPRIRKLVLTAYSPFLAFVGSTQQFDSQLSQYVNSSYVQIRYQQLLGCGNIDLGNTTNYYARYTTSVICNTIVQNSIKPCSLQANQSRPLCAESCVRAHRSSSITLLTGYRHSKPRMRKRSPSTEIFAQIYVRASWTRFAQTSPTARCPASL